ncbi:MAG: sulfurtransferase TusA family protein [Deltaproteobacteria bacterium]|nr:sulfurtransferase TusA family protein [Deltaproteobacteria bacterium]
MANTVIDACGMRCPEPVLKIAIKSAELPAGDTLEVVGDCPTFEKDVRAWCQRLKKPLLWVRSDGGSKVRVQIQF